MEPAATHRPGYLGAADDRARSGARPASPSSSFGFYADNSGVVYNVTGPFADKTQSPAWKAGIREGDQLDLSRMRCIPYDRERCASILMVVGGILRVTPERAITIDLAATPTQDARQVALVAEPLAPNWLAQTVMFFDVIAGVLVILAASWLVWSKPGPMSWGFFLYVIWFNPGQSFELYAQLQRWPLLLLAQDVAGSIAQAAGYVGLLLFVIRAPTDELQPEWAPLERTLPWLGLVIAVALMGSYASAFGFKTELLTRATILFGLVVSIAALIILVLRRQSLTPKDNQRLRWVIWGCLIGLPAVVVADLSQYTGLVTAILGDAAPPEDVIGLLYLVNGILCLFVFEALRRDRVVNVSIPLRRATLFALVLSLPALLLHRQAEHVQEFFQVPSWASFLTAAVVVFAIGQLHHHAVELADRFFNQRLDKASSALAEAILNAKDPAAVDHLLSVGACQSLGLASAATFRRTETGFCRFENGTGWDDTSVRELRLQTANLTALSKGTPCMIDDQAADEASLPADLEKPLLAVPAANLAYCYAATLYGPHESGTALDAIERDALANLGRHAADVYARIERDHLRSVVAALQGRPTSSGIPFADEVVSRH